MEGFQPEGSDASVLNQALVEELKRKGCIRRPSVEAAFRAVLRHLFVPGVGLEEVYSDQAIPTKEGESGHWVSSSSQPAIMAIMLEQLGLQPGHKVLEIGAGTGYNAALMAHIVGETGQVVTLDIEGDLVKAAREHLAATGLDRVLVVWADGGYGHADGAPYDRIILTVGAPDITPAWWEQLRAGGRLVLPLAIKGEQKSIGFEKRDDYLASLSVKDCGFMTLRGAFARPSMSRVQLGQEAGLWLELVEKRPIDAEAVYDWLTGASQDFGIGVQASVVDLGGLWMWLALREPAMGRVMATGDMVEGDIVPPLIKIGGKLDLASSDVLLGEKGLAALTRSPGQPAPVLDVGELCVADAPFPLFVRQFGPDASLAQRLIAGIQAWDAADRPSSDGLHVRAYTKDSVPVPAEGEVLIEKEWTWLVIGWRTSRSH